MLREVKRLGAAAVTVLGNHDLHLLTVAAGHTRSHKKDTLTPILEAPDRDTHCRLGAVDAHGCFREAALFNDH